jgi:hypothetical protein
MAHRVRRRRPVHNDDGSALVIALVFISLFGLLSAALLSFGFSGERTQNIVRGARDARYAGDGAVEGAIQRFKAMKDAGDTDPCAHGGTPFFTYTVRDKTATAACSSQNLGGVPNPPQSLLPSSVTSTDFVPYNTNTSKTLYETIHYMESAVAPGFGGGLPSGDTAYTTYPHASPTPNTISFQYGSVDPIVGNTFTQLLAVVSHREGDGPGDAPAQDQYLTITTRDSPGGPIVNCNPSGTKYSIPDAKASGGPAWPVPPYQTVDVTYQPSASGGSSTTPCLNTRTRVEQATITYNAVCTSGCSSLTDSVDSVTLCVCLRATPSTATSNPTCPQASGEGYWVVNGGNLGLKDCTQGQNPVAVGQPATPLVGLFQPGDPTLVGRVSCGPTSCPSSTHMRFGAAELGVSRTLALSGWSWPSIAPVTYVSLRVSHLEQRPNLVPSVNISIAGGGSCDVPIPATRPGTSSSRACSRRAVLRTRRRRCRR